MSNARFFSFAFARSNRFTGRRLALLLAAGALGVVGLESRVDAAWPPPVTATSGDLADSTNWPNDPGYGYVAADRAADRSPGLWQFYSFIPDRSTGAPPIRPEETASGMSIDLAWRHTIGTDETVIAVLDSGIEWDHADLAQKAFLNLGELEPHKPLMADSSACTAINGFDCNGDGIVTVSDWADDPRLQPDATGSNPKGDANRNGILDAGDLILNFSDGTDDDANGYVDDISGWDFFKNDNDPYDDTRFGHGTGEANDSASQGNNGMGDIGVCPLCRFVPLRVGDSFITDVQDYSQGVVYATDIGAKVVQEALGTVFMSRFAQRAMDYAWANGTVIIASMADENSRHQNVPATANHTLPVHAITMLGSDQQSTTAESFLHFNTCTNYGAQNYLSASGTGCSSEAVGRLSGVAGLVYSMGAEVGLTPPLNAGEVAQLLTMTADDIFVPESADPGSRQFASKEGFDQRFGYGRVNANTAVEWVRDGRIPPDVDITRPYWFEVLYRDQVAGPVPIMGTVSARRANSYDVIVEWAPGVEPSDSEFQVIKQMDNVPSNDPAIGSDGQPLAELDIRDLDVTHERDPDSQLGENDFTITVRVRSVAHYGGSIGDVPGELRRAYYVHEDPDLVDGFPIYIGASGETAPKLADIDGDGVRDIVNATSDGVVNVWSLASGTPEQIAGFPFRTKLLDGLDGDPSRPDYRAAPGYTSPDGVDPDVAREPATQAPALADMNGDGAIDIVLSTYKGTIYVIGNDGQTLPGWPVTLPAVPSCPLDDSPRPPLCMDTEFRITRGAFAAPVLADMDGDGGFEIIQAAFDGFVHVYKADGSVLPGWPVRIHHPTLEVEYNRIMTTPAVGDFNEDGIPDLVVGSNERLGTGSTAGAFYLVDGRGNDTPGGTPYFPNWPVGVVSFNLFPLVAEGVPNSPIVGDVNGDGKLEAVFHGNASAPLIVPADPGTQRLLSSTPSNALPERIDPFTMEPTRGVENATIFGPDSKAILPDTFFPLFAQPALGDLNQDGLPDVTASGASLSVAQNLQASGTRGGTAQFMLSMWDLGTGKMMPASPVVIEDFTFFNNQVIADVSGDGYPEVIIGSGGYYVHAADACGREPEGWPKFTGQWVASTAAVGDLDGDDTLEVVVPTRAGWLYAWHTNGSSDGTIDWESFHHDNRNTGNVDVELDQGTRLGAAAPLPVDSDGRCVLPDQPVDGGDAGTDAGVAPGDVRAKGGCSCRAAGAPVSQLTPWGVLVALGAVGLRRRRKRR